MVAVVFLAAAVPKILDPLTFAKAITNYRLSLPWIGLNYVNSVALFMPALEAVVAIALFWNRSKKAAGMLAGGQARLAQRSKGRLHQDLRKYRSAGHVRLHISIAGAVKGRQLSAVRGRLEENSWKSRLQRGCQLTRR